MRYPPVVDYTEKVQPVIQVDTECQCKNEWGIRFSCYPVGIAVDYYTDNIYVANQTHKKVFVFNSETKLQFCFCIKGILIGANYFFPISISIHNMLLYVKLFTGLLLVYDLSGNFITKIITRYSPRGGFAIDQTHGDIYLCRNFKGEIIVLSGDYPFAYQFAKGIFGNKLDIKLTEDYIYVLSNRNPYIFVFNYNGYQITTQFTEYFLEQSNLLFGLAIDGAGNLFSCNYKRMHDIFIFDSKGQVLHKISSSIPQPLGITIDSNGRIITVDCSNCIRIY